MVMKITHKISRDNFFSVTYYIVTLIIDNDTINEIQKWCFEVYGPSGIAVDRWTARWFDDLQWNQVIFTKEKDFTMFLLRWS